MENMVTKALLKSLVPFVTSLIGPLILTTFRNNSSSSLFDQISQYSFGSIIDDGQPGSANRELDTFSQLPYGTFKLARYREAIVYSYFWFITTMMIIDMIIYGLNRLVKSYRQIQAGHEQQSSNTASFQSLGMVFKTFMPKLQKCVVYVIKMGVLYSLCYIFYMSVFVALYYAISEEESVFQQAKPSEGIEGLNFQEIVSGAVKTEKHKREPRILQALTSNTYQTLFQTSMTVGSILLSRNGHKAFAASLDTASKCSLQIIDISSTSSPIFLGNVSFTMTYTSEYPWGNTLALSSDERVILMATGSELHIIDISDVRHPLKVGLYPLAHRESIQSILISSDSKTAFLSTYTASLKTPYLVKAVNITVSRSPKFIETIFDSIVPLKLFTSGEILIYADDSQINKYNISNLTNFVDPVSYSLDGFGPASSSLVQITSDLEYAYWISYSSQASVYQLYSFNLSSSGDSVSETDLTDDAQPGIESTKPQRLYLSPDGKLIFYISDQFVEPYSISESNFLSPITISSVNCLALSFDEQTLLLGAGDEFYILQLYLNIQPSQVVNTINIADNILSKNIPYEDAIYQMALSPDGKTLYELTHTGISTLNVSDSSSPHKMSLHFAGAINQMAVSPDGQILYGVSFSSNSTSTNFTLYNASDAQVISYWDFDNFGYTPYHHRTTIQSFVITPDGNTALVIQSFTNFLTLDISNPSNISVLSNTTYSPFSAISIALSTDGQTVFISGISMNASSISSSLRVYDISTPSSPKPISEFDQIPGLMTSMTLSYDQTVAYALIEPVDQFNIGGQYMCVLFILNISSLDAPVFITSMNLADNCTDTQSGPYIPVTPDLEVLYVLLEDTSVYVDVSNSSAPQLMDADFQPSQCVTISHDFRLLYITYQPALDGRKGDYGFFITGVLPKCVLSLSSNTLALGSSYTSELNILRKGIHGTYVPSDFYYKFINAQLFYPTISVNGVPLESLPEWINLDETNGFITFSPTSASQVGSYYIYATFSTQISFESFANSLKEAGIPINQTNVSSLLGILTELGYVDNNLFVSISDTSDWSEGSDLSDVAQLEQAKIIANAVSPYVDESNVFPLMNVLTKFLSTAVTKFTISPSLTLTLNSSVLPSPSSSPIAVNTLSLAPLSIVITLEGHDTQPQFVSIGYSFTASFSANNSQINMVNSLPDVNTALSQLVIFLNDLEYCNGTITVVDDLNPTLNQPVFNLSSYFLTSSPPIVNTTYFHSQLATGFPETGTQFAVRFDTSTFTDPTGQPLTFTLQMQDSSLQAPDWLQLTGDTLTGTPPDQLTGRQLDLKIVVSNQYQSTEIEFTLNVAISLEYALKLIGTYGGALITCLGLLVYAPHIYNIICKRLYRYPKDFVVRAGQEINYKVLYPIPFVQQPLLESKIIIRHIEHKVAAQLQDSSKTKITSYFMRSNSYQLDTPKLLKSIQEAVLEIQMNDKTKLSLELYTSHQRELITELVINHFMLGRLELGEERGTQRAFELIKNDLFSIVEFKKCLENGLCKFSVNKAMLFSKLKDHGLRVYMPVETEESQMNQSILSPDFDLTLEYQPRKKNIIETELILNDFNSDIRDGSSVNVDLLIEVLEAYALNQHLVNAEIVEVDIVVRKRLDKISLLECVRRFLKLDLKLAGFSGRTLIGYGIEFKVQENILVFSGIVNSNIKNTTLVVQIVSRRGQILREIWLHGVEAEKKEEERESLMQEVL